MGSESTRNSNARDLPGIVETGNHLSRDAWTPSAFSSNGWASSGTGSVSVVATGALTCADLRNSLPPDSPTKRFIRLTAGRRRGSPGSHASFEKRFLYIPKTRSLRGSPAEVAVKFGVDPARNHKLVMSAALNNPSLTEHQYLIGSPDRAQPVGDNKAGTAVQ